MQKKIINWYKNNPKKVGMILIALAVFSTGFLIHHFFSVSKAQEVPYSGYREKVVTDSGVYEGEHLAKGGPVISLEQTVKARNVQFQIPEEVKKHIPDIDSFKNQFAEYLAMQGFGSEVTVAFCANVVTEDFDKNIVELSFTLNNGVNTTVDVIIDKNKGSSTFNYY